MGRKPFKRYGRYLDMVDIWIWYKLVLDQFIWKPMNPSETKNSKYIMSYVRNRCTN